MNKPLYFVGLVCGVAVTLGVADIRPALGAESSTESGLGAGQGPTAAPSAVEANGPPVRLLSAFFGLDNGLPFRANRLCLGASGQDGMPIVFSHTIDPETLQPGDFQIVTRSGAVRTP